MSAQNDPHAPAVLHLGRADARMAALIARAGPCRIEAHPSAGLETHFEGLVEAIVSQQLSGKAAGTIFGRVRALGPMTPAGLAAASEEHLRAAGLSGAKTRSVLDLCAHVERGSLALGDLHALDDEAVIEALCQVRGIGRWTAEMFLIFRLGRPDVLPVGDLGVQKGFQRMFRLRDLPKPDKLAKLAKPFAPYRSIASWYMWRLAEEKVEIK